MRRGKSLPHVRVKKAKGRTYVYFDTGTLKPNGQPNLARLPPFGDPGFGDAYAAFLAGRSRRAAVAAQLSLPGLVALYERSGEFKELARSTRDNYSIYLARLAREFDKAPAGELGRQEIMGLRDEMSLTPGAANGMVRAARALYSWARHREHVANDPCAGVKLFKPTDHEPWPEELLQAALASDDASIRLPVALMYFTAQRIGDVCAMRWGDVRGGLVYLRQQKTGKELEITVHRDLAAELARTPRTALTILSDHRGRPLTVDSLRKRLQRFAADRGHKVVPHGLRKNAVNALLEAGCSLAETSAVTGQSLKMVEHYAKRRSTRRLASAAILKMEGAKS